MNKLLILLTVISGCPERSSIADLNMHHNVKGQISCLPMDGFSETCRDESGEIWLCSKSDSDDKKYSCASVSAAMARWDAFLNKHPYAESGSAK